MKKLLKIMFGAVAAASVMCGLAACDGGDGECEHVWNEGETTVARNVYGRRRAYLYVHFVR